VALTASAATIFNGAATFSVAFEAAAIVFAGTAAKFVSGSTMGLSVMATVTL